MISIVILAAAFGQTAPQLPEYADAYNSAVAANVPLVVVLHGDNCGHCVQQLNITESMRDEPMRFAYVHEAKHPRLFASFRAAAKASRDPSVSRHWNLKPQVHVFYRVGGRWKAARIMGLASKARIRQAVQAMGQ